MKLRSMFRSSLAVPYVLLCAYGLFSVTTPPQPGEASAPDMPGVAQGQATPVTMTSDAIERHDHDTSAE